MIDILLLRSLFAGLTPLGGSLCGGLVPIGSGGTRKRNQTLFIDVEDSGEETGWKIQNTFDAIPDERGFLRQRLQ